MQPSPSFEIVATAPAVPALYPLLGGLMLLVFLSRVLRAWPRCPDWIVPILNQFFGTLGGGANALFLPNPDLQTVLTHAVIGYVVGGHAHQGVVVVHKAPGDGPTSGGPRRVASDPPKVDKGTGGLGRAMLVGLGFFALGLVGCTKPEAKVAVQVADAACVAAVHIAAPGFEFLCGLAAEELDVLIDREMKAAKVGAAPSPKLAGLLAAKKAKAPK